MWIVTAGEASPSGCLCVDLGSFLEKGVPSRAEQIEERWWPEGGALEQEDGGMELVTTCW